MWAVNQGTEVWSITIQRKSAVSPIRFSFLSFADSLQKYLPKTVFGIYGWYRRAVKEDVIALRGAIG